MLCLLYATEFKFTLSLVVLDCLYDARLLHIFFGEEIPMSVRLFNYGYHLFAPRIFVEVASGCEDGRGNSGEEGGEDQLTRKLFTAMFADNRIPAI